MIRTQVQLREEQVQALRELASARRTSIAELVRQSVDSMIHSSRGVDDQEQRQRAIAAAGRFHSGTSDISSKHDQYLAETFQS